MSWVEPLRDGRLLISDTAGAVMLLDAATGQSCWKKAVDLTPGVRLAGRTPDDQPVAATQPASAAPLYLFDSFSISAVDPADGALLWRRGEWPSLGQRQRVDPEVLPRILAAHATPDGVLALRDDGAMGLLNAADGSLHWRRELGAATQASLHVRDGYAWLLWRGGGRAWAARFSLDQPADELPPPLDVGDVLPIWSRPTTAGALLLVWVDRVASLSGSLERRDFADPPAAAIQQRSIDLAGPAEAPLLVLADLARGIHAYDVNSDRLRWRSAPDDELPRRPWSAMVAEGANIAAIAPDAMAVYSVCHGERKYAGPGGAVVSGGLLWRGNAMYVVELDGPPSDTPAATRTTPHAGLRVRRICLKEPGDADDRTSLSLAHDRDGVRRVMLVGELLVVESAARLAAFRLPGCDAAQDREKAASRPADASGGGGAGR